MQEVLQELAADAEDATGEHEADNLVDNAPRITAAEYCALLAVQVARNFDGIACARSEKPTRELDTHCLIPEAPVRFEGEAADGAVDEQAEGAESRASMGLGALGHSVTIAQRLDEAALQRVLAFDARDRTTAFTKELRDVPAMQREVPGEVAATRRADLAASQQQYDEGLRVAASSLASIADTQRRHFQQKEGQPTGEDDGAEDELAVPPPPREPAVAPPLLRPERSMEAT